jgi:FtsP/CotA-like multicopper oxidase with cupredoxin domain
MKMTKTCFFLAALLWLCGGLGARGQTYTEYKFIFKGMAYQTNAAGNIVGTPMTDQTLLASRAIPGGITDLSTVAIVYHIGGDTNDVEPGDTVDIIYTNSPTALTTEFSLWFGSTCCGRTAVTNAAQSEVWRADYIYTSEMSTYTFQNDDSVGLCLTHKVNVTPTNGYANTSIIGNMSWGVAPQGTNGPIVCIGTFSLGQPLF